METELHVLVALTLFVGWGQVRLVVAVGCRDDFGGSETAAVFRSLVPTVWVGVGCVLQWVVSAFVRAVRAIDGVEEIVERSAFDEISDLVQRHLLGIDKRHRIFEVEIGLSVEVETLVLGLNNGSIDQVGRRGTLDLIL